MFPVISNQRISPYRPGTSDKIQIKFQMYSNNKTKLSYLKDVPVNLFLTYVSGVVESGVTDKYGAYTFYHSCENILTNNCLGYVTSVIDGQTYTSNNIRINFSSGNYITNNLTLLAWYKGDNTLNDELGGNPLEIRAYAGYDPRYSTGINGSCFRLATDEYDSPNELTLPYSSNINISSLDNWQIEGYFKADTASHFEIFNIFDAIGGEDYIEATLYMSDGHLEIYNQDVGIGDPYVNFESLNLDLNTWYKIRIAYSKATHNWKLYINDVEKTATDTTTMIVNDHQYTNLFCSIQWNSGTVLVDDLKIYTI